jgi:hypothetical protein
MRISISFSKPPPQIIAMRVYLESRALKTFSIIQQMPECRNCPPFSIPIGSQNRSPSLSRRKQQPWRVAASHVDVLAFWLFDREGLDH